MKNVIQTILLVINIVFLVLTLAFGAIGIYEQITSPAVIENLLKKIHIPLTYSQFLIIGLVCVAIMIATYILRKML